MPLLGEGGVCRSEHDRSTPTGSVTEPEREFSMTREASMSRHPAGKGRDVAHTEGEEVSTNVGITDATVTVKQPVDGRKNRRPKRKAKAKPKAVLSQNTVTVDPRVMNAARRVIAQGTYTRLTIVDAETVVVR